MKCSQFRILLLVILFVFSAQAQNSTTCPDGYDCLSQQICTGIPIKCSPGTWCPGGYNVAEMCPKEHYCETPAQKKICPEGSFCKTAFLEPKECSDLAPCPEGSWRQNQFDYLLIMIATFVVLFGSFEIYERIKEKYFSSDQIDVELPAVGSTKLEAFGPSTSLESALEANSRLNLRFDNLEVVIPTKKGDRMILAGVSGEFKSGQVSAIMGPSGAGKTTLMSVLSGKLKNTAGKVFVNGIEDSVANFQKLVGYVPQEDVMLRTLRVREVLEHSARIRLPSSYTDTQRISIVNDVLKLLKIDHVADSVIGDAESRGVSGGERKRVNIGMELVALPKLLFLDEPTTGLDSNTSKEIMAFLRIIAQQGITVVMVIHQPRYEILKMCDDLLLLAKGGKTVFMGPTDEALDYFAEAGFPCPTHFNPADWYMDVISGKVYPKITKSQDDIGTSPSKASSELTVAMDSKTLLFDPNTLVELWVAKAPKASPQVYGPIVLNRETPGFFVQFGWFLYRSLLQLLRNKKGLALEMTYQVVTGIAMAMAGISDEMYIPPLPENMVQLCPAIIRERCQNESILPSVPITMFFMTMTAGVSSVVAANRTFSEEKDVYYREAGSGINTVAYFLAKCVFDLYSIARNTFVLLTFYIVICNPPGTFSGWFGGMFFIMFAAHGMGYFFSNLLPPAEAILVSVVAAVSWSVTSGLSPTLEQLEDYGPLQFFWWISYCRWGAESLFITVISDWSDYMRVKDTSGYDKDNYGFDLAMMFVLGVLWRVAAYFALKFKNKDKQK